MKISKLEQQQRLRDIMDISAKWISTDDIVKQLGLNKTAVYTLSNMLVENDYMETKLIKGNIKHATHVRLFKRLTKSIPDDVFGQSTPKPVPVVHEPSLADARYVHDMDKHIAKYQQQSELARREYKSPRVYVGCHDGI